MFGDRFTIRDVLGWLDLKRIEHPDDREDFAYYTLGLERARERLYAQGVSA